MSNSGARHQLIFSLPSSRLLYIKYGVPFFSVRITVLMLVLMLTILITRQQDWTGYPILFISIGHQKAPASFASRAFFSSTKYKRTRPVMKNTMSESIEFLADPVVCLIKANKKGPQIAENLLKTV